MTYKIIEIQDNKLLIENERGAKFLASLDWFAENFIIAANPKVEIISCDYKPLPENLSVERQIELPYFRKGMAY